MAKYVFVTGGVLSSLGKGITAASLGALLESRGYKVALRKFDPYLNYGPGTMSPLQHGEIFVTADGCEGDLDLGHYERFTTTNTDKHSDITSGKIYYTVIERERRGEYLGATVQVIPHITDEIKACITAGAEDYDIVIGGVANDKVFNTVELYFDNLIDKGEAIRRLRYEKPNLQICFRTQKALDGYLHYEGSGQL